MRRLIAVPVGAARSVPHHCSEAIRTKRLGKVSADRGLDVLAFFLADLQTGFGPFIAVYLTANRWSAAEIGTALGVGTAATMIAQVPAGVVIDAIAQKRGATVVSFLAALVSAVLLASFPRWYQVLTAEVLHGIASAMLVPAVTAVTLSRVGRAALPHRLGRNARFMALGNGIGAGVMGYAGAKIAAAAPFWLTAASTLPAIFVLLALPPRHPTEPRPERRKARDATSEGWRVLRDRRLLAFTGCVLLFHGSNAFILPLAVSRLTLTTGQGFSNLVLSACLIVSQAMVALASPWIGRQADRWGRRPVLIAGFCAVPLHAAVLALAGGVPWVIGVQLLDGAGGAMFGVLQPLVAADVTRGTNRFNLALGVLGLAAGFGATGSAWIGGHLAQAYGSNSAFVALAAVGCAAVLAVVTTMPETRSGDDDTRPKALTATP